MIAHYLFGVKYTCSIENHLFKKKMSKRMLMVDKLDHKHTTHMILIFVIMTRHNPYHPLSFTPIRTVDDKIIGISCYPKKINL